MVPQNRVQIPALTLVMEMSNVYSRMVVGLFAHSEDEMIRKSSLRKGRKAYLEMIRTFVGKGIKMSKNR